MQLDDIVGHNILGTGSFGKVFLVTNKNGDSTPYALKCMDKKNVVDNDMVSETVSMKSSQKRISQYKQAKLMKQLTHLG